MKHFFTGVVWTFFLSFFVHYAAFGQEGKYQVRFKSGDYLPKAQFQTIGEEKEAGARKQKTGEYVLVQFYELPDKATHAKIKAAGISLLEYIPNYAFLANVPATVDVEELDRLGVRSVERVQPEHKIDSELLQKQLPPGVEKEKGRIDVVLTLFQDYPLSELRSSLATMGGRILKEMPAYGTIEVRIPLQDLLRFALLEGVSFVSPVSPPPEPTNYYSSNYNRVNVLRSGISSARELTGEGVVIAMGDYFTGNIHADLQGRVRNFSNIRTDPHGDHTSGTLAGAGNLNPLLVGMAPKASLIYNNMVDDIYYAPDYYQEHELRITSNSYSLTTYDGRYSGEARNIDIQTSGDNHPELLHVFAAANQGPSYGTVSRGWAASKNALVVGAVSHGDSPANFSSRGPVEDGRIKPEVVALGTSVMSTNPVNEYASMGGTSAACPAVAGSAALLYQRYKQLHDGENPDAGLVKALLCNTAEDMGNPGPDFIHGFGRINVKGAVEAMEEERYFMGAVGAGESATHSIEVPSGTAMLKVMLYWRDKEAAMNSAVALVNDLDLQVKQGGETYLPWVLNPEAGQENTPAVRGVDHLNNIEQVTIENPSAGSFPFTVNGSGLATESQGYVVVYEVIEPFIAVTFPYAGEALAPGDWLPIRWDKSVEGPFTVEYSLDNGNSWELAAGNVAADRGYANWEVPDVLTHQLLVRVSNGAETGISAGPSSIMEVPKGINVYAASGGGKQMSWRSVPGASGYDVFQLSPEAEEIQLVASVEDTSYLFQDISSQEYWFSVRARSAEGAVGRRSNARKSTDYRSPENPSPVVNGLNYAYYEGNWTSMPDFESLTPVRTGSIEELNHGQISKNKNANFAIRYTGYIHIPEANVYTFHIFAHSEGQFYIGDQLIVQHSRDRDGQGASGKGSVAMQAGLHRMTYDFYKNGDESSASGGLEISHTYDIARPVMPDAYFRDPDKQQPVVRFDSPSDGAVFQAPATIDIALDVNDPDDLISRIDLFGASQKLVSFTEAPYSYSWKEVGPGNYSITAKIVMTDGTTHSEKVDITVEEGDGPGNQSPVVDAGEDQRIRLPENTASFTATASDLDGAIASWLWEQLSGPVAAMAGTDSPTLSVEELQEGTYAFKVLVTDNEGATAADEVQLFVEGNDSGNQVPVVSAGSDKTLTLPTNSISLSGTGKDSDGRFVAFLWEKMSGPSVSMSSQNTANVKLADLVEGVYVFRFSGTDNEGATGTDEMTLTVKAGNTGNQVPVVSAGSDKTLTLPTNSISLSGTGRDSDGRFVAFLWEKVSGPSVSMSGQHTANVKLTSLVEGVYVFRFSGTDNEGATGTDEMTLTVKAGNTGNQVPVVSAGSDKTLTLPTNSISLSGTGKDSDGRFVAFLWEKMSGPSVSMSSQNTANVKLADLVEGVYVFRFSGTDNEGATGSDEMTLTVKGSATAIVAANIQATAYPNTFQDFVNLRIEAEVAEVYRIDVYDLQGKVYHRSRFVPDLQGNQAHRIDLSDVTIGKGMYILRVENESGTFRKLIKVIKNL